jgi:hypothetical protein
MSCIYDNLSQDELLEYIIQIDSDMKDWNFTEALYLALRKIMRDHPERTKMHELIEELEDKEKPDA